MTVVKSCVERGRVLVVVVVDAVRKAVAAADAETPRPMRAEQDVAVKIISTM
jgi:hypothetical protein